MAQETITRDPKELVERLWMWKNQEKFCDATLSVNGQRIPVHSVVLASFSQFFENTFEDTKISPKEVTFTDVDIDTVQSIIEYCYKGSLDLTENNALDMFQMASILEVPSIVESSARILKKSLNSENCLATWKMAKIGENDALKNHIIPFAKKNIDQVSKTDEYVLLEYSDLLQLFSSEVKANSEIELYKALKLWINYDASRTKHLNQLLGYVKLECLPNNLLISEADSICDSNRGCFMKFLTASSLQRNEDSLNCSSSKSTLVVMGGGEVDQTQVVEIYDLILKKWAKIDYRESTKYSFGTALLDEKLIIIGGSLRGYASKTVEYYDLKTGQIGSLPQMKYARKYVPAVCYANEIFVFGNYDSSDGDLTSAEKWSPSTKTWQDIAPMTVSRTGMRAAVLDDNIFVIGGYSNDFLSVTEAYNPITNNWKRCQNMNEKRNYPGVAAVSGFLYVVGGNNSLGKLNSVEKYDSKIDKWSMIQSFGVGKYALAAGNLNGQLVITGGFDSSNMDTVEAYDEKNNKWTTLASLNKGRSYHWVLEVPWSLAQLALTRKT